MVKMKMRQSDNKDKAKSTWAASLVARSGNVCLRLRCPNMHTHHDFRVVLGLLRVHKDGERLRAITCHWRAQGQTALPAEGEMFLLPRALLHSTHVLKRLKLIVGKFGSLNPFAALDFTA